MLEELEVLRIVSERLEAAQLPFMLTGSFAMAYYGKPRMTRDLDIVVSLGEEDVRGLVAALSPDFYIDEDSVRSAVISQRLFNLMHLATSIKVDLIVRKGSEYRQVEFARRQPVQMHGVKTWIVSREDLILSKLVWARDSGSELQRRDVRTLLDDSMDRAYLERGHSARRCRSSCGDRAVNDTSLEFEAMVNDRYRRMTPDERVRIAASMYDTARAIVLSSLPPELSRRERRLAFARRFYEGELPEAALIAYAEWDGTAGVP